jgi:heat-inducible transcriptional repressor
MNSQSIPLKEAEHIEHALFRRLRELDELIAEAGRLLSDLTNYAAFTSLSQAGNIYLRRVDLIPVDPEAYVIVLIYSGNVVKNTIAKRHSDITDKKLQIISELLNIKCFNKLPEVVDDEFVREVAERSGTPVLFVRGVVEYICQASRTVEQSKVYSNIATKILDLPEYQDVSRARRLINYMSDTDSLACMVIPKADSKMRILIGPENVQEELQDSSVVMASYDIGDGMRGMIGVIGPTRMDYPGVESRLRYFARRLNRLLNDDPTENG